MTSLLHTFSAGVVIGPNDTPDDVVAVAQGPIANHHLVASATFKHWKRTGVVFVQVKFKSADQDDVVRVARLAAEALSHRWPTDTVKIDGRSPKYHRQEH